MMDYSQKLYLPRFEDDQTGDNYCYSTLNLYQLGIFDVSTGKDLLHSCINIEVEVNKGVNNKFLC